MNALSVASFTNVGFRLHSRRFQPITQDLSGKTIVITGGTGGLGLAAASALSELGARVAIVGRNRERLVAAQRSIEGEVAVYQAELSLMSEVRHVADRILSQERSLDVLVNNVGVLLPQRQVTSEGLERTLATNLAGHFLLTNLVIPKLADSSPSRIINVSSGGMYSQKIQPDDLAAEQGEYKGSAAYARTKRGQAILTEMWAERLEGSGVVVHSMHPGWARTAGVRASLPTFDRVMRPLLRTPEQGADTIVWLAASPELQQSTGGFWFDRRRVPTHLFDTTRETARERAELWESLVALTGSNVRAKPAGDSVTRSVD